MLIVGIDGQNQVRCCEEGVRCSYTHEGRAIVLKDDCPHFSLYICRMPVLLQEKLQQKPYEMQVCLLE